MSEEPATDITVTQSLAGALLLCGALAAMHVAAPRLRTRHALAGPAASSFAGGLAVAYVFVHLLPEVAAGNETIGAALGDTATRSEVYELAVFVVALAGFTAFYGLERAAERRSEPTDGGTNEPPAAVFAVHLGAFAVYNAVIAYTMALRVRTGLLFAALFAVAVGLHVLVTDRSMSDHYPRRFRHSGRYVLVGALLLGWGGSALAAPTSSLVVALLTAVIAGSVLLHVFSQELPSARGSRFGWFLVGLVGYTCLLVALTLVEPAG